MPGAPTEAYILRVVYTILNCWTTSRLFWLALRSHRVRVREYSFIRSCRLHIDRIVFNIARMLPPRHPLATDDSRTTNSIGQQPRQLQNKTARMKNCTWKWMESVWAVLLAGPQSLQVPTSLEVSHVCSSLCVITLISVLVIFALKHTKNYKSPMGWLPRNLDRLRVQNL